MGLRRVWRQVGLTIMMTLALAPAAQAQVSGAQMRGDMSAMPPILSIAVILPGKSADYLGVTESIKAGMRSAQSFASRPVALEFIDTDESVEGIREQFNAALGRAQLVVGPLTRDAVAQLSTQPTEKPVLMLNVPEAEMLPLTNAKAHFFGMSLEAEARQSAEEILKLDAAQRDHVMVVSATSPLARRTAHAFLRATEVGGGEAHWLATEDHEEVHRLTEGATTVFLAGDAGYVSRMRPFLPRTAVVYATSQANSNDANLLAAKVDVEGVRITDMPWVIDRESPVVIPYLRPEPEGVARSLVEERLYAFGVDSIRVAIALLERETFDLEGLTGQLRVRPAPDSVVERHLKRGVIKEGVGRPLAP